MHRLLMLLLCLGSQIAHAEQGAYGELHVGAYAVDHSDLTFYPSFVSGSAGWFVHRDIGVEVFYDSALRDDGEQVFDLSLSAAGGLALRMQSPLVNGLQAYMLLGIVRFTLEQEEADSRGQRIVRETFDGARVSLGLSKRLSAAGGLMINLEYRNYYVDQSIHVDAISTGLRYVFN